jgi:2-(3-amino-3-carboxypropyl)histidine synthase
MQRLLKEWDDRERHASGEKRRAILFLMAELNPTKIAQITGIDVWVQISCPRLSIDWGTEFKQVIASAIKFLTHSQPTLTSYEFEVLVGSAQWTHEYPMDYYRKDGGSWANYYQGE